MDYKTFSETVVKELQDFYGGEADIEMKQILQNNDVQRNGLFITFNKGKEAITPFIYLDSIFESFSDGSKTMSECIGMIATMRKEFAADNSSNGMATGMYDWNNVKDSIYPALISVSENKELLKNLVYTPFLDLATIYIIRGKYKNAKDTRINITNAMLNTYGIEKADLHTQAMSNLERDDYEMEDTAELLYRYIPRSEWNKLLDIPEPEAGKMYMITNSQKFYGAAALLNTKLLEQKLGSMTSFILPSSVHETLVVPISDVINADGLNEIIREVNHTQLDVSERLSDHFYIYDGDSKRVKMCA